LAEAAADWVVSLAGDGAEEIDRPTFDSCLACHSAEWTDGDGRLWAGVPLYLIAGRIDGGDTHGEDAYDAARAETGYSLEVVAADGFTGEIPSSLFHLRETVLLAATLDGEPLGDDGPLRVVGPGLTGRQQVARVVEIAAVFAGDQDDTSDEGNAAPSDAVPPPGAALAIGGLVDQALDLDADGLAAFEVVEVSIEHPKDGERAYVGIPIAHLLTAAGPAGGAATLTVVAGDGYSAEVGLAELAACEACLLAFDGDVLSMALSGFSGSAWVGDVVAFEIS
jgi:DMSO/TMAO reductase YedYZ molybdopterin-dependent catalytic subunit